MTKSLLSLPGEENVRRLLREASAEAHAENLAAGLIPAHVQVEEMRRLEAEGLSPEQVKVRMDELRLEARERAQKGAV
ncbi:MAG: hypothetical protein V4505_18975 [Pseudomonadota bacterium]